MVLNKIGSDQSNSRSSWGNRGGYSGANNNGGRCCFFLSSTFLLICNFSWNFLLQFIKILAHHIGEATMVVKSIAEQEEVRTIQTDIIHSYIQQWFWILLFFERLRCRGDWEHFVGYGWPQTSHSPWDSIRLLRRLHRCHWRVRRPSKARLKVCLYNPFIAKIL